MWGLFSLLFTVMFANEKFWFSRSNISYFLLRMAGQSDIVMLYVDKLPKLHIEEAVNPTLEKVKL